jgi:hypothetical protein
LSAAAVQAQAERASVVSRCIQVARECLEGDPFRAVPELQVKAAGLWAEYDGADPVASMDECRDSGRWEPAHVVAEFALSTAGMARGAYT